ncbi:MAG TPA: branched-chain-amino-acid transaminase [Phycisphaerales bacterium]|jgi:branched-chain amino acid aminotransferase|nr:branched-chain-amino-acid transaminase [Phycisphaerales bacterium]
MSAPATPKSRTPSTANGAGTGLQPVPGTAAKPGALNQITQHWNDDPGDRPLIYINGKMLPKREAMVSVYDHGLLYGDGVFEGIRVYRGRIFKCQSHMDRLYRCAEGIHLKIPISQREMIQVQRDCIAANNLQEGYIRLVITRGFGTLGLDPRRCPAPGIICIADQIRLYPEEAYKTGMGVVVAKRPKTPIACLDPRIKSLNYLNNILAKMEAIEAGCDEAIMLSTDGYVTECTGDNIFIIKNGRLFTPPSICGQSGLLEGVTRKFVMQTLARDCNIPCEEKLMRLDEVMSADEVFLTGTAAEIIAVHSIADKKISQGEGPLTAKLRHRFREIVTSDHVPED